LTLAAYATLLARTTGRTDLLIGTPVAGRTQPALENLLGCFINTLVLRLDLAGNPAFSALLDQTRGTLAAAVSHPDLPFERLMDLLDVERSLSHPALVQTVFMFQPRDARRLQLGDLAAEVESRSTGTSRYDLLVSLAETTSGIDGWVEYDT